MGVEIENLFFPAKIKEIDPKGMLKNQKAREDYIKIKKTINAAGENYLKDVQMLLDITDFKKNLKILDVGCGLGIEIIELANLGADCVGLDAVEDNCNFITEIGKKYKMKIKGDYGDGCDMPYENNSFDIVMSKNYFEHVKDFDLSIKEQTRVLKYNGKLIIRDGNVLCPLTLFDLLIKYPLRRQGKFWAMRPR